MIYKLLKRIISNGNFNAADVRDKLDVYLMFDRLTLEEYEELSAAMDPAD